MCVCVCVCCACACVCVREQEALDKAEQGLQQQPHAQKALQDQLSRVSSEGNTFKKKKVLIQ